MAYDLSAGSRFEDASRGRSRHRQSWTERGLGMSPTRTYIYFSRPIFIRSSAWRFTRVDAAGICKLDGSISARAAYGDGEYWKRRQCRDGTSRRKTRKVPRERILGAPFKEIPLGVLETRGNTSLGVITVLKGRFQGNAGNHHG